jgi:hypothetical protein
MTRRTLTHEDAINAIYGGCILGGGGGGRLAEGLSKAAEIFPRHAPVLATIDEFDSDAIVPCVALVGAPSAKEMYLSTDQMIDSVARVRNDVPIVAIMTNENGAATTTNGWLQAAALGLPVLDSPANGRAHPTGSMGALNLSELEDYVSFQAFAGGKGTRQIAGTVSASLDLASSAVRSVSIQAGGMVSVCRNPVSIEYLSKNAALGGITQAIKLGQVYHAGTSGASRVSAVNDFLGGSVLSVGTVTSFRMVESGGFDVGEVLIGDIELTIWNEYMTAEIAGQRVGTFPDLIMTLDTATGEPIVSAELCEGRSVTTILVPRDQLLLSSTMNNPKLLKAIEPVIGKPILANAEGVLR